MRKWLLITLVAALALRITLIITMKTYLHPVTWEYENMVNNLLCGKGFMLDNYYGTPYKCLQPLYTFLNAGVYAITNHSYLAILLVQSILSVCLVFMIFQIANIMFGERVAILSAFLTAFHPGFVYYDVFNLMPQSLDSLLIATAAWLLIKFKDSPTVFGISLVGFSIGLGALSRGIIGTLLPFLSVYFLIFTKHSLKDKIKYIFILWVAAFIVIAPWTIRNYVVQKEFVLISSSSGEAFYRGNNTKALGTSLTPDGRSVSELWPKEINDKLATLNELEQKKFFEKEAISFIKDDPISFAKLYAKKFYYFWWFSHQSGAIYPKSYLAIYKILYVPLFAFTVLGAGLALISGSGCVKNNAWLIIFVFMSVCLTQSLFYVEGRHRWLIEPLMLIFCSFGFLALCGFLFDREKYRTKGDICNS